MLRQLQCLVSQGREDTAKRQHDSTAQQLRTCTDHRCTMDALLNPDGVPLDFLSGPDSNDAMSLAQQPWYRVLYIAQVSLWLSSQCGSTMQPGPVIGVKEHFHASMQGCRTLQLAC